MIQRIKIMAVFFPLAIGALVSAAQGQVFGERKVISTDFDYAYSVHAADLDGDGDSDVLAAAFLRDSIAWHENLGGGRFGPPRLISTQTDGVRSVYAKDLDGDGDTDVLSASILDNKVAWYENLGGRQFGPQTILAGFTAAPASVFAEDLDGDGDADVLSACYQANAIVWHENLGAGTFAYRGFVTAPNAFGANSVHAADVDGDGDADVLSTSLLDDAVSWYENLGGSPLAFGAEQVIYRDVLGNTGAASVYGADLDGDGDADALYCAPYGGKIAWFESLGGGIWWPETVLSTTFSTASSVRAVDIDGDGDLDVLAAAANVDKVMWFENDGGGTFVAQHVVTREADGPRSVHAVDLDGDGDIDVLSASCYDDTIAWYENTPGIGSVYCTPALPNSTQIPGRLYAAGSTSTSLNTVDLIAEALPTFSWGYFVTSQTQGFVFPVANSQGALCLGGMIGRHVGAGEIQFAGSSGSYRLRLDLMAIPGPQGSSVVHPGETWNFQAWYRDGVTSNFTDAVSVTFA